MSGAQLAREALRIVRLAATDPVAFSVRLNRIAGVLRAHVLFRECQLGKLVNAQGAVRIVADGAITIEDRVQFVRGIVPAALIAHRGAEIVIGQHTVVGHGIHVEARRSVRIGARCMLASTVRVCDTDRDGSSSIVIGDDVWLAHGVVIEPGVAVGAGSVVSAGSVVRRDVPPRSLAAGCPATSAPLERVDLAPRRAPEAPAR